MSDAGGPPPGWYDDPERPGQPRWWDGHRWAPAAGVPPTAPGTAGGIHPPASGPGNPAATADLAHEHRTGSRAKVAVWAGLVLFLANNLVSVAVFHDFLPRFIQALEDISAGRTTTIDPDALGSPALSLVSQLLSLGVIVVGVLYLVWFHRAVRNAGNLGLRLRFTPGWAVAGFIIPLASWVMPFLSAKDLFPAGHRGRRLIAPWWAAFLVGQQGPAFVLVLSLVGDVAVWTVVAVCEVALVIAAVYAVRIIDAARDAHVELARGHGFIAPDFDPAVPVPAPVAAVPDPWARASGETAGGGAGGPWG